jgi:hypothetical protein
MSRVIQSYLYHDGKCFFVSTINRESSSMKGGTYAETMVWDCEPDTHVRGLCLWQGEAMTGSIRTHLAVCQRIADTGICDVPEDEE